MDHDALAYARAKERNLDLGGCWLSDDVRPSRGHADRAANQDQPPIDRLASLPFPSLRWSAPAIVETGSPTRGGAVPSAQSFGNASNRKRLPDESVEVIVRDLGELKFRLLVWNCAVIHV